MEKLKKVLKENGLLFLLGCLILVFAIGMLVYNKVKLNLDEEWVLKCVQDLHDMMKDEDSFKLEGDIVKIVSTKTDEIHTYVYIPYSGCNSYGGRNKSIAVYDGYSYLCNYYDEVEVTNIDFTDDDSVDENIAILNAQRTLCEYKIGETEDLIVDIVKASRIENKVK